MLGDPGLILIGAAGGVLFSEAIRAFVRRITKGRFFGPVPATDLKAEQKAGTTPK